MKITHSSESTISIELPNGKSITIMYYEKQDELSIAFHKGKRYLKEMQNRSDGYNGASFTKAES